MTQAAHCPDTASPLHHLLRFLKSHQVFFLILLASVAFILGYLGFKQSYTALGLSPDRFDLLYLTLQLFVLESGATVPVTGWMLQCARILAPLVTFYSLVFFIFHLFREKVQGILGRFARDHVIIFGNGAIGPVLLKKFSEAGYRCIRIMHPGTGERENPDDDKTVPAIVETSTIEEALKNASIGTAGHIFLIDDDDGVNLEVTARVSRMLTKERVVPLNCYTHLNDPELSRLFRERQLNSLMKDRMRIDFFNIYHLAGSLLLTEYSPFTNRIESSASPHILVIGLGRMGQSVLFHTVRKWRSIGREKPEKVVVSVIDRVATEKIRWILTKYPSMNDYSDIRTHDIDIESAEFLEGRYLVSPSGPLLVSHVFVCLGNEASGLVAALEIHKMLEKTAPMHGMIARDIPLVVTTINESGFTSIVREEAGYSDLFMHVFPFPILQKTGNPGFLLNCYYELIARSIHERYLAAQASAGVQPGSHPSLVAWDQLPEEFKESNRRQADDIINKMNTIRCTIRPASNWDEPPFIFTTNEIERLSLLEHQRWMREKTLGGWKYGPVRDDTAKIHPSLVSWDQLSESEKEKDRNAVLMIPFLLQMVDLNLERNPE